MTEGEAKRVPELIIPERVGLFERQYKREWEEPDLVPMNPAVVPLHAIAQVQDSINWVAGRMVEHPTCQSSNGWKVDPDDPRSAHVSYVVKRVG